MCDEYTPTVEWEPLEINCNQEEHSFLGQRLLDRYEIFGTRQGGFSIVFFVFDLETGQKYAVKTHKPKLADSLPNVEKFKEEIGFWINLDPHPHIVRAYFVEEIKGQPHLFTEYVFGGDQTSLREKLSLGALEASQAIEFAYQICLGMEFANQKGEIAHLDLKPENILSNQNSILKITDFGLAHYVKIRSGRYPRISAGTWPYAAPEQFINTVADTRSDIYTFGVILYEMLTGDLPYPFQLSKDTKTCFEQLHNFHKDNGGAQLADKLYYQGIPGIEIDGVNAIMGQCLHRQSERFQSFAKLRRFLERDLNLTPPEYVINTQISNSSSTLHSRALTLHKIGNYSKALSLFNQLLQKYPDEVDLWLDAARTLLANGQIESARHFLQKALFLDPNLQTAKALLSSIANKDKDE